MTAAIQTTGAIANGVLASTATVILMAIAFSNGYCHFAIIF